MSSLVPSRSARGCLTCKQRRKKCDEKKPTCDRCTKGRFQCLGYDHLDILCASTYQRKRTHELAIPAAQTQFALSQEVAIQLGPVNRDPGVVAPREIVSRNCPLGAEYLTHFRSNFLQILPVGPSNQIDIMDFIVPRYMSFADRIFRPLRFSIQEGIVRLFQHSSLSRWSMYLGARVMENISIGTKKENCSGLIRRLHHQSLTNPAGNSLETRLMCCQDLSLYTLLESETKLGYSLFKRSSLLFLELANSSPELQHPNFAISLHMALASPRYGISRFASFDTLFSMLFATPPLVLYDTVYHADLPTHLTSHIVESVYGWPVDIFLSLGTINAWRLSQWTGQTDTQTPTWQEVQAQIERWRPSVEYLDEPSKMVGRFAIYEAWRHSALIYLYMGMCMVNSADPRVEAAVRQVAQLASTLETGSSLETHVFIPCYIAGIAARLEKHRALLRNKLFSARVDHIWLVPAVDMVPILDHLWHSAGANGSPTTWEDYVVSRCETLPLGNGGG